MGGTGPPKGEGVIRLDTVTAERVTYLWPGRLPLGKLVVLDGDPSVSKSTLTLDLGARVSIGADWPDGEPGGPPGDVLILSAEDGLADTIVPRLKVAGAELTRIHAMTSVQVPSADGTGRWVSPEIPRDLPIIQATAARLKVKLIIVDVLMAYLSGDVNAHKDQDVRSVLKELAALAEKVGCTIILIRHMNKTSGGNVLYRGGGSIGIIGAARAAYVLGRDPDDADRRILAVTKMNVATEPLALAYRLTSDARYGCARVEWEDGPVEMTAAQLLRAPEEEETGPLTPAAIFVRQYLAEQGGSAAANQVIKAAAAAGFSPDAAKKGRKQLAAGTRRDGFGPGAVWVWTIDAPIDAIGAA